MQHFTYKDSTYELDEQGFLKASTFWDTDFAEGMAKECGIAELTKEHWDAIHFVRDRFAKDGVCPTIFATCKVNGLRPREMKMLFPQGYHRGLCRIAGIHYRMSELPISTRVQENIEHLEALSGDKEYRVDVRGFLTDPKQWDEHYATHRALDMGIPRGELSDDHWRVIRYLREAFQQEKKIPTIYETCEKCQLDFERLEALFPHGYHRGALKIAGLRFVK